MAYLLVILFCAASTAFAAEPFTLDIFERLLEETRARNVDDVLPHLPGDLRSRYVMVEDARGLQQARPGKPRIIMRSGGVYLAFNDEELRNGRSFEAIERRADGTWEFRRYIFPVPPAEGVLIERNPRLCKSCHGLEPKPLWSPFPFWPGVLGEGLLLTKEEDERFAAFTRDNETHPRYRHLFRAANHDWARNSGMSPAWTLQDELEKPLARQLARQLSASASFREDRFALLASFILCDDVHAFLPAGLAWNHGAALAPYRLQVDLELERLEARHREARALRGPGARELHARLSWLTGERGLELGRWGGFLEARHLLGTRKESYLAAIEELLRLDPELALPRDSLGQLTVSPYLQKQLFGDDFSLEPGHAFEHARVCRELAVRARP